jgi:hypothetical protein
MTNLFSNCSLSGEDKLKQSLQELAWKKASEILEESGYNENANEKFYALRKYEMQFVIYQQLKMTFALA